MALQEEFERSGRWLFRWRSYVPLVLLALCLFALPRHQVEADGRDGDLWWEAGCLFVSLLGLGIRCLTIGYVPSRTSGRNTRTQRADSLNTTGMYSVVRHPLYLGNAAVGLGVVLFTRSWWMTILYALAFWIYYERIMFAEESYLKNKFGAQFMDWSDRTPAFFPRLSNWKRPLLPFSGRTILRRECNGLLAIIVAQFTLEVAGDLIQKRGFELDTFWVVVLTAGVVTWAVLRILSKNTNLLRVANR
ncbi:MAG: isoprenylcysteine carboxylmethyltransferase family protein [Candidatus Eisenbacteria bacterium]|nr:isoprenylcysteine carboxylmethyltransferase family protein [Candidatus Eisenbacteria bacterium]